MMKFGFKTTPNQAQTDTKSTRFLIFWTCSGPGGILGAIEGSWGAPGGREGALGGVGGVLGPSWARLGAVLAPSWGHVGPTWAILGHLRQT